MMAGLGGPDMAALVRVAEGPAQILMTVYMLPEFPNVAPKLQVMRLADIAPPGDRRRSRTRRRRKQELRRGSRS